MINPEEVINYNRTLPQKEEFLLFCIFVANKSATFAAEKLSSFLGKWEEYPFFYLKTLIADNRLDEELRKYKVGQYTRISTTLRQIIDLDLNTCDRDGLVNVYGIGMKTASYFLSCTREKERFLIADVHILKMANLLGWTTKKSTPDKKLYLELEKKYLNFCDNHRLDSSTFDLEIWKHYAGRKSNFCSIMKGIGINVSSRTN